MEKGLLSADEDLNILDYKAYCHASGKSAQIHLKDKSEEVRKAVAEILNSLKNDGAVDHIFTKEQLLEDYHLDGDYDLMVEGAHLYSFVSDITREVIMNMSMPSGVSARGKHGHLPTKENKTVFAVKDGNTVSGVVNGGVIVDIAPTIMKHLSIEHDTVDGKNLL
jgi:predicted AlkP superfamily phosphohydrolase/phosphomutase